MSDRDRYELPIPTVQRSKITLDISIGFVGFSGYTLANYFGSSLVAVLRSESIEKIDVVTKNAKKVSLTPKSSRMSSTSLVAIKMRKSNDSDEVRDPA